MSSGVCYNYRENFNQTHANVSLNIGYSKNSVSKYSFIVIPALGIIINSAMIILYIRKKQKNI
jgi:hypothetical protein